MGLKQKTLLKVMLTVVATIAVAAVLFVASAPPTEAIGLPGTTTYYSNATYTVVVGRETNGCCGEYSFWGQKTKWKKFERFYCPAVPCPN
jgi:hypothetical protein